MKVFPEFQGPMEGWPRVETVDHAEHVLAILHQHWFIALATNAGDSSKDDIRKAFSRVNLLGYLDEIYCFKEVGYVKPSLEFFDFILNDLNVGKTQAVMIGDDFKNDIQGANRAGIRGIWLNTESDESVNTDQSQTIHDLRDLPGCLDQFIV